MRRPTEQELTGCVNFILSLFQGRQGFMEWWQTLDEETRTSILFGIRAFINALINKLDQ